MIVIDASVAVKLINKNEEHREYAQNLYQKHLEGKEKIVVPELLFIEVANYLATKTNTTRNDIKEGIFLLEKSSFIIGTIQFSMLLEATFLAKECKTTVYDMLYVVVAKMKNTILITADEKFIKRVNLPYVKSLTE